MSNRNNGNNNLIPFSNTPEGKAKARAAGLKSVEVRKAKREAERLATVTTATDATNLLTQLQTTFQRETLGPASLATAALLITRISTGAIEVDGRNAADLIRTLVDIGRLESGEATSQTLSVSMSADQVASRLAQLRGEDVGGGDSKSVSLDETDTN